MSFEFDNNMPIYIQLVEQIKINIISGNLKPMDRLPSVRELALQTKVNPNTMQKALAELEETGLIFTERTNGKYVTGDQSLIDRYKKEYAQSLARNFLQNMQKAGFTREEALGCLREMEGV